MVVVDVRVVVEAAVGEGTGDFTSVEQNVRTI